MTIDNVKNMLVCADVEFEEVERTPSFYMTYDKGWIIDNVITLRDWHISVQGLLETIIEEFMI